MKINKQNLALQIIALIGLALSIKLAFIYYVANYEKYALSSFCSINDFIDCDGAARSLLSQFLGIPLAYWGIFFYITVLFLAFVDKLKQFKILSFLSVFKNPMQYIACLGTIAFFCSMILACQSLFNIHKLCILCLLTYFLDFFIALVASSWDLKQLCYSFKTTFFDFIEGAKNFPKTCTILLLLSITFLTYSGVTYNFIPHVKKQKAILKYKDMKFNPYRVKGNILGNPKGNVVIELYSDYVCPLCYIHNIMLHKAVKEFNNIKIVHHNYPFDKECNHYINVNMHPNACFMARGAIAAGKQNNYWEMSSLLYENQPKKMDDMLKLADKLGFNRDTFINDFNSVETENIITNEIDNANNMFHINSTPTMYINGDEIIGVKPYYELKDILIQHGAKRK